MAFNLDDYEMVKDRIPLFYAEFPDGRITTEIVSETDSSCTIRAFLWKNAEEQANLCPLSTGIAKEWAGGMIEKYTENCSTSAIGRAISNRAIYGKVATETGNRPSREEMSAVRTDAPKAANPNDIEEHSLLEEVLAQPGTELVSQVQGSAIPIHKDGNPMYVVSDFKGEMQPRCAKHMGKGDYASEPARMWPVEWDPHQKEGNDNWKIQKVGASESIYKCTAQDSSEPEKYCLRFVTQAEFKAKHVAF